MSFFEEHNSFTKNAGESWSKSEPAADTMRFEVRGDDYYDNPNVAYASDDEAQGKNRSEVGSYKYMQAERMFTLEFDMMIEGGAANTADWLVLAQLHQSEDKDANGNVLDAAAPPPFAIGLQGEELVITGRTDPNAITTTTPANIELYRDDLAIVRDQWYAMKVEIVMDHNVAGSGSVKVWRDSVLLVDYDGPLGYNDEVGAYLQMGVYREQAPETFAAQFRDVSMVGEGDAPDINGTSGDDNLQADMVGFREDETLNGYGGNDTLNGGEGDDVMNGGSGNDTYVVNTAGDVVNERSGGVDQGGVDAVQSYITYTLGADIENLTLAGVDNLNGFGNNKANEISGNAGNNLLRGYGGDDRLLGAGGVDTLYGGDGNDSVFGGAGNDFLYGDGDDDRLYGELGDDVLNGGDGNDILEGGAGNDSLSGGAGDDQYAVSDAGDLIFEYANAGNDIVRASVSFDVGASAHVETINTTNQSGTGTLHLTGSDTANTIRGNDGFNILIGRAGNDILYGFDGGDTLRGGDGNDTLYSGIASAGIDTLDGGAGDDTFYVDSEDAMIIEAAGQGNDTVRASVSVTLAWDAEIENLRTTSISGTAAIDLIGSTSDNEIRGNDGANLLDGRGGADRMFGYGGNDTYVIDNIGDLIYEYDGNGTDTVISSINFTLGSVHSIEVLQASSTATSGTLYLTGNAINNTITGNAGDNVLSGRDGNDVLSGGAGDDTLNGDNGNDRLTGGTGNDMIYGGAGTDTAVFTVSSEAVQVSQGSTALIVSSANGIDSVADTVEYFEFTNGTLTFAQVQSLAGSSTTVVGTVGNDWLTPVENASSIDGRAGVDMVSFVSYGAGVSVNLSGGTAASGSSSKTIANVESITGSIYGDYIAGDANDNRLRGLGDYDWFVGSDGNDLYEGGTGRDMISYVNASGGIGIDLSTGQGLSGQAAGDTYMDMERVTGSVHSDYMIGSADEDEFRGLGGYDWFVGSDGGKDRYDGGSGLDTVAYTNAGSGVVASLILGRGSAGQADRDIFTSIENLTGSNFDDTLTGDNGRNILRGMYGEDRLFGNGGTDRLTGGGSDDYLDGGSGWDYAFFSHNRSEYNIATYSSGATVVQWTGSGGDGRDVVVNIEALVFADELVYL
jgi:Ca2+-binding RTX toxin-like protein